MNRGINFIKVFHFITVTNRRITQEHVTQVCLPNRVGVGAVETSLKVKLERMRVDLLVEVNDQSAEVEDRQQVPSSLLPVEAGKERVVQMVEILTEMSNVDSEVMGPSQ